MTSRIRPVKNDHDIQTEPEEEGHQTRNGDESCGEQGGEAGYKAGFHVFHEDRNHQQNGDDNQNQGQRSEEDHRAVLFEKGKDGINDFPPVFVGV